ACASLSAGCINVNCGGGCGGGGGGSASTSAAQISEGVWQISRSSDPGRILAVCSVVDRGGGVYDEWWIVNATIEFPLARPAPGDSWVFAPTDGTPVGVYPSALCSFVTTMNPSLMTALRFGTTQPPQIHLHQV